MRDITLLDCTLRDGGYVNSWDFGHDNAKNIIELLQEAQVEIIECGIFGVDFAHNATMFDSSNDIKKILPNKKRNIKYAVMLNYSDTEFFTLERNDKTGVDIIRLAFFKEDAYEALDYAKKLKGMGYSVFLQAMATHMYSNEELKIFLNKVNNVKPDAFYLVDSFGIFNNSDIELYYLLINSVLDISIAIGFHAHNNLLMAVSNVQCFIEIARFRTNNRSIIVDASIAGMGRGAGNCPTEIIMEHLNCFYDKKYKSTNVLIIYEMYLQYIKKEFRWGYSYLYHLCAIKEISPAYGWYINKNITKSLDLTNHFLNQIPEENKHKLNTVLINKLAEDM